MRLHWWCMGMAKRFDAPGYPPLAAAFDIIGGWAAKLDRIL